VSVLRKLITPIMLGLTTVLFIVGSLFALQVIAMQVIAVALITGRSLLYLVKAGCFIMSRRSEYRSAMFDRLRCRLRLKAYVRCQTHRPEAESLPR
jgi:hypothetical protein